MKTTATTAQGVPWHKQKLSKSPVGLIKALRQGFRSGDLTRAALDHNSEGYRGYSNKEVKILGAWLRYGDARFEMDTVDYEECFAAVMDVVIGA